MHLDLYSPFTSVCSGQVKLASYHAGFRPLIPKTYTSNNVAQGRFAKTDFIFIASDNEYLCPAGERLRQTGSTTNDNKIY